MGKMKETCKSGNSHIYQELIENIKNINNLSRKVFKYADFNLIGAIPKKMIKSLLLKNEKKQSSYRFKVYSFR